MSRPVAIRAAELPEFVGGPGLAVVFVSVHPAHRFNLALCGQLGGGQLGGEAAPVACGTVELRELLLTERALPPFYGAFAAGGGSGPGVLPGYWLFRQGRAVAWDAGLPRASDLPALARGALVGALWSAWTRRVAFLGQALRLAADEASARRIGAFFRDAAARPAPPGGGFTRPGAGPDDLLRAYQTLGVDPAATDEEVKRAWRRRHLEIHPDLAANDPAEFQRRTRLAAELNRAREVILEERRRTRARATA